MNKYYMAVKQNYNISLCIGYTVNRDIVSMRSYTYKTNVIGRILFYEVGKYLLTITDLNNTYKHSRGLAAAYNIYGRTVY